MRSHSHHGQGTQNQGNTLGDRSCVRQSKLFRQYESGNSVKDILGVSHLAWKTDSKQGAYMGHSVYDHSADAYTRQQPNKSGGGALSPSSKKAEAAARLKAQMLHDELTRGGGGGRGRDRDGEYRPPLREENILALARRQPVERHSQHDSDREQERRRDNEYGGRGSGGGGGGGRGSGGGGGGRGRHLPSYGDEDDAELEMLKEQLRRLDEEDARQSRLSHGYHSNSNTSPSRASYDEDDSDHAVEEHGATRGYLQGVSRADLKFLREDAYLGPRGERESEGLRSRASGAPQGRGAPHGGGTSRPSFSASSSSSSSSYSLSKGNDIGSSGSGIDNGTSYDHNQQLALALRRQETARAEVEAIERQLKLKAEIEMLQKISANPHQLTRAQTQAPFADTDPNQLDSPTRSKQQLKRKQELLASMTANNYSLAPMNARDASQALAQRSTRPW